MLNNHARKKVDFQLRIVAKRHETLSTEKLLDFDRALCARSQKALVIYLVAIFADGRCLQNAADPEIFPATTSIKP